MSRNPDSRNPHGPGAPPALDAARTRVIARNDTAPGTPPPAPSVQELRKAFAPWPAITLRPRRREFHLAFPYDREMIDEIKALRGSFFDRKTSLWHVRLHAWQRLLELAPRIQELADRDWRAAFTEQAHEDHDDLTLALPAEDAAPCTRGSLLRHDGQTWRVTHVSHPWLQDGRPFVKIHLARATPQDEPATDSAGQGCAGQGRQTTPPKAQKTEQ